MNISAISFGSVQPNNRYQRPVGKNSYNNPSREKEYDLFKYSLEPKQKKKHPILKKTLISFLAGMATLSGIQSCNAQMNKPGSVAVVPYNQDVSIEEYAQIYDVEPEAILACNHINENHMEDVKAITIPKKYSHL